MHSINETRAKASWFWSSSDLNGEDGRIPDQERFDLEGFAEGRRLVHGPQRRRLVGVDVLPQLLPASKTTSDLHSQSDPLRRFLPAHTSPQLSAAPPGPWGHVWLHPLRSPAPSLPVDRKHPTVTARSKGFPHSEFSQSETTSDRDRGRDVGLDRNGAVWIYRTH